jgi:hypothetical protein
MSTGGGYGSGGSFANPYGTAPAAPTSLGGTGAAPAAPATSYSSGGSFGGTPAPAPQPQASPVPQYGGGGGGGSAPAPAMAAAATQVAARPSLDDYIKSNFLYTSAKNQGDNALSDYNAGTIKGQQNVEADQGLRNNRLDQSLADQGNQNADNLAAHGLLRSGFNFQNQDKINQQGDVQRNNIANMLTDFLGARNTGQQAQVNSNQQALNNAISQLTTQFNSGQTLV